DRRRPAGHGAVRAATGGGRLEWRSDPDHARSRTAGASRQLGSDHRHLRSRRGLRHLGRASRDGLPRHLPALGLRSGPGGPLSRHPPALSGQAARQSGSPARGSALPLSALRCSQARRERAQIGRLTTMTITAAHIAEARALNPLTASRDAIAAASKIPTTHRRVGHAPLAGRGIDLRKLVRPLASLRRLLPSQRSLERATVVAIAVALLLEVLVAAGVHYSAFKNPGD